MRHATVWALDQVHPWLGDCRVPPWLGDCHFTRWRRIACSWEPAEVGIPVFTDEDAAVLSAGGRVELPTCPACAALLDLAIELRGGYQTKED